MEKNLVKESDTSSLSACPTPSGWAQGRWSHVCLAGEGPGYLAFPVLASSIGSLPLAAVFAEIAAVSNLLRLLPGGF